MKKILLTLALLLGGLVPQFASAQGAGSGIEPRMFDRSGRTFVYEIPDANMYGTSTGSVTRAASALGTRGLVMTTGAQAMANISHITQTSSLAALPYPANLRVAIFDSGSDNTISCSRLVFGGLDWKGTPVTETLTSLVETTVQTTTTTFSRLTSLAVTGCNGFGTSDQLQVYIGYKVGLPWRIQKASDILSVCYRYPGATNNVSHCTSATPVTGAPAIKTTVARKTPSANGVNIRDIGTNGGFALDHSNIWVYFTASQAP